MHLLRVESGSIDDTAEAVDLAQSPAEMVALSFTDADLAVLATAWEAQKTDLPTLRLANLTALRHPYSIDLYADKVLSKARFVLVRLLGGMDYWRYGTDELATLARSIGFHLAVIPGDHRKDPRLDEASTLPPAALHQIHDWFAVGGPENIVSCLHFIGRHVRRPPFQSSPTMTAPASLTVVGHDPTQAALSMRRHAPAVVAPRSASERGNLIPQTAAIAPPRPAVTASPATFHPFGTFLAASHQAVSAAPNALIIFYRSWMLAADTAPVLALSHALAARGFRVSAVYVTSLKDEAAAGPLRACLAADRPDIIVNLTAFSGRSETSGSPLDQANAPVLQCALSGGGHEQWMGSQRGLGPADLAMNVVLPELDGRIFAGAISFKAETPRDEALEFTRLIHRPDPSGIAHAADLACAWANLARTPRAERRLACILSDYPAKGGRTGYAVGLDTPESVIAIARRLAQEGFSVTPPASAAELITTLSTGGCRAMTDLSETRDASDIVALRGGASCSVRPEKNVDGRPPPTMTTSSKCAANPATAGGGLASAPSSTRAVNHAAADRILSLPDYRRLLATLPADFVNQLQGDPADDPAVIDGWFRARIVRAGNLVIAVQPDRSGASTRKADYHDPLRPPRHGYVAFYLWLRAVEQVHAIIHCGTHGTLEWLPGKATALSASCAPRAILGPIPLIYPFIVNNPGEAAQAKRRTAAVTVGHLTPPLTEAGTHGATAALEALLDEYAQAQSLDPSRAIRLAFLIMQQAQDTGLAAECGITPGEDPQAALAKLDAFLCDIKEMRIGDGLHVFGRSPEPAKPLEACSTSTATDHDVEQALCLDRHLCQRADALVCRRCLTAACGEGEMLGLLAALDGRFVQPGPAGAPDRGRTDVLPTGRNLYSIDPRSVPTRTAWELGRRTADALLTRHAQDHGDWPRRIVLDIWGSATMRTGGDDLAQAFALIGCRPRWDSDSSRVAGFDILPLAILNRPRIDVTLRISGLFRDVFPTQIALFDQAVRAVAALDEAPEDNPVAASARAGESISRLYGSAPGAYGIGLSDRLGAGDWTTSDDLGQAYLAATSHAYGTHTVATQDFRERVAQADAYLHVQDLPGQDVLDSDAFAEHEAGFAAAAAALGNHPALYHADTTDPDRARIRTVREEVARVLRARATNPRWLAGQMRHGHRGAAEIAQTIDNGFAYAALAGLIDSHQFDLLFDATIGDDTVRAFLAATNPAAAEAIATRFAEATNRGLWTPRRNSAAATITALQPPSA